MDKSYQTLSYFQRAKRRKAVILTLETKPKTPKEIAKECKISISNVSNTLAELLKEKYVECVNPDAHTYKYFKLTTSGKNAINLIKKS